MDDLNKTIKELERILTIDGQGRPAKARMLLALINSPNEELLKEALEQIGERKFF